jgi:5-methylcytosine-specific restriction protein B
MNIYRLQMKEGSNGATVANRFLDMNRITTDLEYSGDGFDHLTPSDVIMVHTGSIPLALVRVINKVPENELAEGSFGVDYCIEILSRYSDLNETTSSQINLYGYCPPTGTFFAINPGNSTYNKINRWFNLIMRERNMQEKLDILKFKKQIILQGPPGTGKTKLAKEIASSLLTKKITKSPLDEIKDFLVNHKVNDDVQFWRKKRSESLAEFQMKFPLDQLLQLNLDTYCIGKSNKDNFCWWIERGLESYGRYSPGFSINYGVYFSKTEQKYKTLKRYESPEAAMEDMKTFVSQVANEVFDAEGFKKLGDGFILKILASYYPEKYIQVYKPELLKQIAQLIKLDSNSHYIQLNQELNQRMNELIRETSSTCDTREIVHFLFQRFLGGNETEILEEEQTITSKPTIVQFHPSYSYEDFVRGIVAEEKDGQVKYAVQNKTLAELAKKALEDPDSPYVLIIDEINRANLSSVLGELIYALEYRDEPVNSMYALEDSNINEYEIIIPSNLYIIGTMNTSDRSVGHVDYAIRRRFAFVDVLPEVLSIEHFQKDAFKYVSQLFIKNFDEYAVNPHVKLQKSDYLNDEFRPEDIWLGHSYFIAEDKDFGMRKKYEIVPILKEYVKDGILRDTPETWKLIDELAE